MRVPKGQPLSCENGKQKSIFDSKFHFCAVRKRILENIFNFTFLFDYKYGERILKVNILLPFYCWQEKRFLELHIL